MKKEINKVIEFHSVFKQEFKTEPSVGDMDLAKKRYDLGKEELDEYLEAVEAGDIVEILDALVDQAYILFGTVIKHGLQDKFARAFNLVHENNMTKLDENGNAILAPNGKIIKPDNFVPVDLSEVFNHTGYRFKTLEEFKETCEIREGGSYACGKDVFTRSMYEFAGKSIPDEVVEDILETGSGIYDEWNITIEMLTKC